MKKFLLYLLFLIIVAGSGFIASPLFREIMVNIGVAKATVPVSGTGSMYPTFPKSEGVSDEEAGNRVVVSPQMYSYPGGINLLGNSLFSKKINRGDIVEFENNKTDKITTEKYGHSSGFVKRVVALEGDVIELRNGFVYLNGDIITEAYTAKPRSTYGGDFLPDCHQLEIPKDSYFVMGDNRKASLDSRFELGLINGKDIHYFMPLKEQSEYQKNWRETSNDQKDSGSGTLDTSAFVKSLNLIRTQKNISPLRISPQLGISASIRGKKMLDTDDFSIEATRSGMTLDKAVRQSDYRNVIFAEVFTKGFYESDELLENLFEFPDTKKLLLSSEYQDIGVSVSLSEVNGCPTEVTVIHLGGYKPPNYKQSDIESWNALIENIRSILPSWESLKNNSSVDQAKVDRLLEVLHTRLNNAEIIHNRLLKNEWLNDHERAILDTDSKLEIEAEKLIGELNG